MIDTETARVIRRGDPLSDWSRQVIGRSVQLRLPLRDPIDARRLAAILREYANRLEVLSHSKDSADRVMMNIWMETRLAQGRLTSQTKTVEKPKRGE